MKTSSLAMIPLALLTLSPPAMGMFQDVQQTQVELPSTLSKEERLQEQVWKDHMQTLQQFKNPSSKLNKEQKKLQQWRDWELQMLTLQVLRSYFPDHLALVISQIEQKDSTNKQSQPSVHEEMHALAVAVAKTGLLEAKGLTQKQSQDFVEFFKQENRFANPPAKKFDKKQYQSFLGDVNNTVSPLSEHLNKAKQGAIPLSPSDSVRSSFRYVLTIHLLANQKQDLKMADHFQQSEFQTIIASLATMKTLLGSHQINLTLLGEKASHHIALSLFNQLLLQTTDPAKNIHYKRNVALLEGGHNVLGSVIGGPFTRIYEGPDQVLQTYRLTRFDLFFALATERNEETAIRYMAFLMDLYACSRLYHKYFDSMNGFRFATVFDNFTRVVDLDESDLPLTMDQIQQADLEKFRAHAREYFVLVKQTPEWEKMPSEARDLYKTYDKLLEEDRQGKPSFVEKIDAMVERIYTQWIAAQEKALQGSVEEQPIQQIGHQVEEQKVDETPVKPSSSKEKKNKIPSLEKSLKKFCQKLSAQNPPVDLAFSKEFAFPVSSRDRKVKAALDGHPMQEAYQKKIQVALEALQQSGPQAQGFIHGKHILRLELSQGDRALFGVLYKTGDQHQGVASVTIEYVGNHRDYEDQSQAMQALLQKYQQKQALLGS